MAEATIWRPVGGTGEIAGLPAHAFFRVTLSVLTVGLSAGAIVAFGLGQPRTGALLGMTGGLLGVSLALGRGLQDEQQREQAGGLGGFR